MNTQWEIVIRNDFSVEKWGPYESEQEAKEVVLAFVGIPESAVVRPSVSHLFDGCPS